MGSDMTDKMRLVCAHRQAFWMALWLSLAEGGWLGRFEIRLREILAHKQQRLLQQIRRPRAEAGVEHDEGEVLFFLCLLWYDYHAYKQYH